MADEILILGATGKTGRRVVRRLREAGRSVRAASRSGETRFDWNEQETWAAAVAGIATVYLIAPDDPAPVDPFVRQAVRAGAGRFVVLSGRGAGEYEGGPGAGFGDSMVAAERAVRASGADWSIIRPNNFAQNFDEDIWRAPLLSGRLALPTAGVPEPFVDVEDVAEVAAALLTEDGHSGRIYDLTGPRTLPWADAIAIIARAAGREIAYEDISDAEYRSQLLAQGVPEDAVAALAGMFALHRAGLTAEPADGVRRVLGREATDFEVYAERVWG
ncbi:NAD(P)H-binding protein [Streptomyces sp. NPDC091292]|uniref:NAD(P)H-binding protein n=1 Tax=Streptomyces sp. NPDC091292 TaxID=3365991 RepID=UPI00380B92FF